MDGAGEGLVGMGDGERFLGPPVPPVPDLEYGRDLASLKHASNSAIRWRKALSSEVIDPGLATSSEHSS